MIVLQASRYLPTWESPKNENWDNDYRWSPESPHVKVKMYRRASIGKGEFEVTWEDLAAF